MLRLAAIAGLGPVGLGVGLLVSLLGTVALVLAASGGVQPLLDGTADEWLTQDVRVAVVLTLMLAYLPAAQCWVAARAEQTLRELAPVLDLEPDEMDQQAGRIRFIDRRGHRRACLVGLAIVFGLAFVPEIIATSTLDVRELPPIAILHRFWVAGIGLLAGSAYAFGRGASARLARLTRQHGRLDLFDLRPWRPLGRLGLINAFSNAGVISLLLLLVPDRYAGEGLALSLVVFVVGGAALAAIGLVMPLVGLRDCIRTQKRARLDDYHRELASLMDDQAPPTGRLADLTAYKRLLDEVSEWPLDLPQMGRFALLFGLPLLSWIAAALVERLLDQVIG